MSAERISRVVGTALPIPGDNIDTDRIIPARFLKSVSFEGLEDHLFEDDRAQLAARGGLHPIDDTRFAGATVLLVDANFGCGSSREHAPVAIKGAGVSCVIAATFARIFFRNALNIGLPIVESAEAAERIEAGDTVEVEVASGRIINHTKGETYQAAPFPPFVQELVAVGGLVPYVAQRLKERAAPSVEGQ